MLRSLLAANPSALTIDGTRTYLVGARAIAVIDPGPALSEHIDAIAAAVRDGGADTAAQILLTHSHPDHADAAQLVAARLGARVRAFADLADGEQIATDAGALVALRTPGHTPDHVAFHWPAEDAVFVGDLMMGGLDTALVAAPEGNLGAYLASLERLRALRPRILYPAHGPAIDEADAAIARYLRHREQRERQVLDALRAGRATGAEIVDAVYGAALEPGLRSAALAAVAAYLEQLQATGRATRVGEGWRAV